MMSWSPTTRRNGVEGLASLLRREDWRSVEGDCLRIALLPFLGDADEICRWFAARVVHLLDPDPVVAIDLIRTRLEAESELEVGGTLVARLSVFTNDHASLVDQILYDAAFAPWLLLDESAAKVNARAADDFVQLVLNLALRDQRPHACSLAQSWFEDPADSFVCDRALTRIRSFLTCNDTGVRKRAFALLLLAAETAENTRTTAATDSEEFEKAFLTADQIATTIYLGSGAAGGKGEPRDRKSVV